jgi:hypothetical protein
LAVELAQIPSLRSREIFKLLECANDHLLIVDVFGDAVEGKVQSHNTHVIDQVHHVLYGLYALMLTVDIASPNQILDEGLQTCEEPLAGKTLLHCQQHG